LKDEAAPLVEPETPNEIISQGYIKLALQSLLTHRANPSDPSEVPGQDRKELEAFFQPQR